MRRRFISKGNYLQPMYFEAVEDGLTVSTYTDNIEYRIGIDGEWKTLPSSESTPIIGLGEKIFFRRVGRALNRFITNKKFKLGGDCRSLLHGAKVSKDSVLYSNCFNSLFKGSLVTEIEDDFLPATTLAEHCYDSMFRDCINLVKAPVLPATTLNTGCYSHMFYGCTKLNYIKMLATDISATDCLFNWVSGVASTGTFVKSKDATWDVTGVNGVPTGWKVITDDQESEGSQWTYEKHYVFVLVEDIDGFYAVLEDTIDVYNLTLTMLNSIGLEAGEDSWYSLYIDAVPDEFNITFNGEKINSIVLSRDGYIEFETNSYYIDMDINVAMVYGR